MKPLSEMSVDELRLLKPISDFTAYADGYVGQRTELRVPISAFDELARRLAECEKKARNEAYERAALKCEEEEMGFSDRWDCAKAIRAMKEE